SESLQQNIYLKVKPTRQQIQNTTKKLPNNAQKDKFNEDCSNIAEEIWYYVSQYIPPEDIRSFALICKQTAALVNSVYFWKNIYQRYVHKKKKTGDICEKLIPQFQIKDMSPSDIKSLRANVIKYLYLYYEPLSGRLDSFDSLQYLIGRIYCASWYVEVTELYIMCFKLKSHYAHNVIETPKKTEAVVDDWESLSDEHNKDDTTTIPKFCNPNEGEWILAIFCNYLKPFPSHLLYGNCNACRLISVKKFLGAGMRIKGICLEFSDTISNEKTIVKYPHALCNAVYPWWSIEFKYLVESDSEK
ncbi:uncharacterized protein LOC119685731, partial [Teleopsis dalmanni]|uniref:uncharacterized protein LOC119685731 n=1 Tax=Teleopsis dalmanni TaxID=139649 RepID=UPI0018CD0276